MACQDCLKNCEIIVPDKCIVYTGPEIPLLGVCPGDTLYEFEAAIVEAVVGILDGTGIEPADVSLETCEFIKSQLGVLDPTLSNILQILINSSCTLKALIDEIDTQIANNPAFNTACLTGLPANPTRDQILQAAVTLLCSIKTTVDAFPSTYVQLSDLTSLVTNIVTNIINGGGTVQYSSRMVPYVAVPYFGSLSNFDSGGIGVPSLGFEKIYICNGSNGTPDIRGRVVVGAVRNIPGGALDSAVDPSDPNNPNWGVGDKVGTNTVTLIVPELPSHVHTITDPGHVHLFSYGKDTGGNRFSANWMKDDSSGASKATQSATTGITVNSTGGNQPHTNIQPSIASVYIMYIP